MPAKSRRPKKRKPLSMQAKLQAHMDAIRQRDYWAQTGLELLAAGKKRAARAAYNKAAQYDETRRELERDH